MHTNLTCHAAGALGVHAAYLSVIECLVQANRAASGAAILVTSSATVEISGSNLTENVAEVSGGAIQVRNTPR